MEEGLPKLWVIRQALHLRRGRPEPFGVKGEYTPLAATGERAKHVVAFVRGDAVATIVPRLVVRLGGDFGDTSLTLPGGRWRNELTGDWFDGGAITVARLLARFPVALLSRDS